MIVEYRTGAKLRRFYSVADLAQEVVVEALHHRDRFQYQDVIQKMKDATTEAEAVNIATTAFGAEGAQRLAVAASRSAGRVAVRPVDLDDRAPSRLRASTHSFAHSLDVEHSGKWIDRRWR